MKGGGGKAAEGLLCPLPEPLGCVPPPFPSTCSPPPWRPIPPGVGEEGKSGVGEGADHRDGGARREREQLLSRLLLPLMMMLVVLTMMMVSII